MKGQKAAMRGPDASNFGSQGTRPVLAACGDVGQESQSCGSSVRWHKAVDPEDRRLTPWSSPTSPSNPQSALSAEPRTPKPDDQPRPPKPADQPRPPKPDDQPQTPNRHEDQKSCPKCPKCPAPEIPGGPSVFIFPPKPKDTLTTSQTPEVTCVVVDVSQDSPDVQFSWYVENKEVNTATTKPREEQFNSTYRVVSILPVHHQDWLSGKEFKWQAREPQVYVLPPHQDELSKNRVSVTCLVKDFYPPDIVVEWQSNGRPELAEKYSTTPPQQDSNGSYFLYSKLSVETNRWNQGVRFACENRVDGSCNPELSLWTPTGPSRAATKKCRGQVDAEASGQSVPHEDSPQGPRVRSLWRMWKSDVPVSIWTGTGLHANCVHAGVEDTGFLSGETWF
ncbi:hypothetical protein HPG69_006821 [Diceros bicornis minor]|uniref:Ig-like domain-containing protein n=1 Tax=Diceros bicornis minor TaxID=77932 RepID=A0A7J7EL54_DICBM|nr:hypothetical protein HPG69_006821 [Diceros bicornis minor]